MTTFILLVEVVILAGLLTLAVAPRRAAPPVHAAPGDALPIYPDSTALLSAFTLSPYAASPLALSSLVPSAVTEDAALESLPPASLETVARTHLLDRVREMAAHVERLDAFLPDTGAWSDLDVFIPDTDAEDARPALHYEASVELLPGLRVVLFGLPGLHETTEDTIRRPQRLLKSTEGEGEGEGEGEPDPYADLDLETDFTLFVSLFLENYVAGSETTFDLNGFTVLPAETEGEGEGEAGEDEVTPAPNGIPDLAELLLIQTFLQDPTLDFSAAGGPSHAAAAALWNYFDALYGPAPSGALEQAVYRVGLAYSCVGDFMSLYLGAVLLSLATETEFDVAHLVDALAATDFIFSQSGDVDGDQYSALLEWQAYGAGSSFAQAYAAYEAAVLDANTCPASITLHTVTRTADANILLFYPPEERVAAGTVTQHALFLYDPADFTHEPRFDHFVITGEAPLAPRYSGAACIEVAVTDDVTIAMVTPALDPSATVTFADANLEAAVRAALGKPSGALLLGDVQDPSFTTLHASNQGIVSLDGLEHCRSLLELDLSRNSIADATPLETLYRLEVLNLGCNLLDDLEPLANLHDLQELELGIFFLTYALLPTLTNGNRPDDLAPLVGLRRLEYLGLTDTGLDEEALTPLMELDTLEAIALGKNPGLDLAPVASMTGLLAIINHDSGLTTTDLVELEDMTSLIVVFLHNNALTHLDALEDCVNMEEVYVLNNPNFSTVPDTFLDMSVFSADGCALTDISPLGDLALVRQLSLADNSINDITPLLDIAAFDEYASINLLDNPLDDPDTCTTLIALRNRGVTVQENAAQCRYTLTYQAGPHGGISGTSPQTVFLGDNGTPVTAVPDYGHYFLEWSDSRTDNPRTDLNVTEDITVTALFAPNQYTLVYLTDGYGVLDGPTPQYVYHGEDGQPVTALPDTGYHFTGWDDGSYDNPRVDLDNTQDLTVSAAFALNQYTLSYAAGAGGTLNGDTLQWVYHGEDGDPVEALPHTGYHFVHWSDAVTDNPRVNWDVAGDIAVVAGFGANTYTLSFDPQGGATPQPETKTVTYGQGYGVLAATTRTGYAFSGWWTTPSAGTRVQATTPMTRLEDHTIYARWTARQYWLAFNSQGGTAPVPSSRKVTYGQPYGMLPVTTREGYEFEGWWTHATGGTEVTPETLMLSTLYMHTLYARWTRLTATLVYLTDGNGIIDGEDEQVVNYGECGLPVTALPDTGYHFVAWDDAILENPRMDCYNTEPLTVTAGFAVNQYTLAYVVNPYGTLSGDTSQTVSHGDNGTAVTVLPSTNCSFVQWSDGSTANPRTDSNVTGDITVTAVISPPNAYVLQYTAGPHGAIQGAASQTVVHGNDGTAVTAVPDTGHYFLEWSDSRTDNPRTDVNVTGDSSITALFAANQYTLSYAVGDHGWLWGPFSQTVAHGLDGAYVMAIADEGYRFAGWSDGWTSPHGPALNALRRDTNVTHDVDATATFTLIKYNLTYTAGANGALSGETAQQVDHGYDGTLVEAIPDEGYTFVQWSDGWRNGVGEESPLRTDITVTAHVNATALFVRKQYVLNYVAGNNINLSGPTQQLVNHGEAGKPVSVLAEYGYRFTGWSDDSTAAERIDKNVTADITVTANAAKGMAPWPSPSRTDCYGGATTEYEVEFFESLNTGVYTKIPDKPAYAPGEVVTVRYTLGEDERFCDWRILLWQAAPLSSSYHHFVGQPATDAHADAEISFIVTDNTEVWAMTDSKTVAITVNCASAYGTCTPSGTLPVPYGSEFSIKVTPHANAHFGWWKEHLGSSRYEESVKVKALQDTSYGACFLGLNPPPPPAHEGSVLISGGDGEIYASEGGKSATVMASPFLANSSEADVFYSRVDMTPQYFPCYWAWSQNGVPFRQATASYAPTAVLMKPLYAPTAFTLVAAERIVLNLMVEGEGMVPGYLPFSYNPTPYYTPDNATLKEDIDANKVTLRPRSHPGWEFSHWEIMEGEGWMAVRDPITQLPIEGNLDIWMNWWQHPEQPDRIHVSAGEKVFNVKAVFLRPWVILLSGESDFSGINANESGINTGLAPLLRPCFNVSFHNEDDIGYDGQGVIYNLLLSNLERLSVKSIALIGHSHGGGSIYNLCNLLNDTSPEMDHNEIGMRPVRILFTGYVDAIREREFMDTQPEVRYPLGSFFHGNIYQLASRLLNGAPTVTGEIGNICDPNDDINTLNRGFVTHGDIDNCVIVHEIMRNRLASLIYGEEIIAWQQVSTWPPEITCGQANN